MLALQRTAVRTRSCTAIKTDDHARPYIRCRALPSSDRRYTERVTVHVQDKASPLRPLQQAASMGLAALVVFASSPLLPSSLAEGPTGTSSQGLGTGCVGEGCIQYSILIKEFVVNRVVRDTIFGGSAEWRLHGRFGNKDLGRFDFDPESDTNKRQVFPINYTFNTAADELPLDLVIDGYEDDDTSGNDALPTLKETFEKNIAGGVYTLSAPGNDEGQYDVVVQVTRTVVN